MTPWLSGGRTNVGNPDLRWETTRQLDFGLDLAFFNSALKFNIDYLFPLVFEILHPSYIHKNNL